VESAEDEGTLTSHINNMKKEMMKAKPNLEIVSECMRRTVSARQSAISSSTVDVVLAQFPALKLESEVQRHLCVCLFVQSFSQPSLT